VGSITAFIAATIALVKTDIKRVLAFSTLSQLGYMVMSLGAGDSVNGMFHLTTHAMFKALLFLGAGSVIHAVHTQEMPEMGGLRRKMPITFITFLAATLAISGVPGFSGFYSKDGILGSALAFGMTRGHYVPFVLGIVAAAITPFYMFRIIFLTFFGEPRDRKKFDHAHESGWTMASPLVILAVLAVVSAGWKTANEGWFAKFMAPYDMPAIAAEFHLTPDPAASFTLADRDEIQAAERAHDSEALHDAIAEELPHGDEAAAGHGAAAAGHGAAAGAHGEGHLDVHHVAHVRAMTMSIIVATLGILASWWVYHRRKVNTAALQAQLHGVYTVLQGQYFFDEFYAATFYRATLWWSAVCAGFDRYVIDGIVNGTGYLTRAMSWLAGQIDRWIVDGAVNGVAAVLQGAGEGFRRLQPGRVQTYLVYASASVLLLVLVYRVL
jgi:NADH-quinone oxidoreductase subunit L